MPPIPKRKTERAPAVDKLLKPAIAVVVALLAYIITQAMKSEIPRIDVTDELALRELFFGEGDGKNYAALCHAPTSSGSNAKPLPISSVFQDAKSDGAATAEFVLVDCTYILPSGKSIADRFELDLSKRPTIFLSGKIGPPKQIPDKHLKTGQMLVKALKHKLEPHASIIQNTKHLKECLNQDLCVVFLKGGPPEKHVKKTFQKLITEFPKVQFASMDSSVLLMTNLESTNLHEAEFSKGTHRLAAFKKVSGSLNVSNATKDADEAAAGKQNHGRLVTSVVAYTGDFHHLSLNNFISDILNAKYSFTRLPALPVIKTRSKKNEQAERTKRQRYSDQKMREAQRKQDSTSDQQRSPDGIFTKEQRKADRDRLRDEHRKKQKVRDLTPEEIAERERLRRQRMEEEAAKWNVLPDDAPPEGEMMEEDIDNNAAYADEDAGFGEWIDAEEDIMDLDS